MLPAVAAGQAAPTDVLPNLVQVAPSNISVQTERVSGRPVFRLGFDSATENRGAGRLRVRGFRSSGSVPTMQVDQLVDRSDGSERTVPGIGSMRYVVHADHQHWHYLRFARYSLRPVARSGRRRDRKTGFCLGDRYRITGGTALPGFGAHPPQSGRCGLRRPDLLEILEGISTGYGDNYFAHLEGQSIDITGLRARPLPAVPHGEPDAGCCSRPTTATTHRRRCCGSGGRAGCGGRRGCGCSSGATRRGAARASERRRPRRSADFGPDAHPSRA